MTSVGAFNMAGIAPEKMVHLQRWMRAAGPALDNAPEAAD